MDTIRFIFIIYIFSINLFPQTSTIDNFENLNSWHQVISDGAAMNISLVPGFKGNAVKIDYQFKGDGYCGIVKEFPHNLPPNYKFNFYCKGISPKNNLEFKLDDSTGDNVWWYVFRRYDFPKEWTLHTIRKRQITFAWGPKGGGELSHVNKIELIISAAEGGSGTVYLDELSFSELPPPMTKNIVPLVKASSTLKGEPSYIFDGNNLTQWKSKADDKQSLVIDFKYLREYGGLIINWDSIDFAADYEIQSSDDLKNWNTLYSAKNNWTSISIIPLQDNESSYMKINLLKSRQNGYGIKEIEIENYKFAEDDNYRFEQIAKHYPEGYFPKYFLNKQTYWNIIGVNGGHKEALINEEGMIETEKEGFSIEPFLFCDNKFITWNDVNLKQELENDFLPISNVTWQADNLKFEIKAFADGKIGSSSIYVSYTVINNTDQLKEGNLYLAVRPFQVNPPWQNLNITGGVTKISSIDYKDGVAEVNQKIIIPGTKPANFGAAKFSDGSIINFISKDTLPPNSGAKDEDGFASAAFRYPFKLNPKETYEVVMEIPFYSRDSVLQPERISNNSFDLGLQNVMKKWNTELNGVKINLPSTENKLVNTLKSNIAYILINRNGNALQPGPRCYDRSWIRDGALMSASLLRMGIVKEVKDYINWYSVYQFPSGKIPCVVDKRGADPVPENDSQGEYIYLIREYFNFTNDTSMLVSKWDNIKAAVNYIKSQIAEESTPENKNGTDEQKSFYGLVPASISHEGYSAKPMHSYWDDFFVLKGLKDAVFIAELLNKKVESNEYKKLRDEFRENLYNSISLAMKNKNINYIPGCAELGDFDATSTTIAVYPCNELKYLPQPALKNTFNKYYDNFEKRLNPDNNWINYTPYEIRAAGTFIFLNEINRAYDLLDYFINDQRPQGWNHWAEVVWENPDTSMYIGDMPHTWVGSAFIDAVRALFVYENENDSSLTLGAGIKQEWLNSPNGISFENFPTYYGTVSYSMKKVNNQIVVELNNHLSPACKKLFLKSPENKQIKSVSIDDTPSINFKNNNILFNRTNKKIIIQYQ